MVSRPPKNLASSTRHQTVRMRPCISQMCIRDRGGLVSIAGGTVVYMVLVQFVLPG